MGINVFPTLGYILYYLLFITLWGFSTLKQMELIINQQKHPTTYKYSDINISQFIADIQTYRDPLLIYNEIFLYL